MQPRKAVSLRAVSTFLIALATLTLSAFGCGDNIKVNNTRPDATIFRPDMEVVTPSSAKAITAFSFDMAKNAGLSNDITATINGTTITATVPSGTNVSALVATYTTTGKSVSVGGTAQTSGTSANNFTSTVDYTVTAEDNSTQVYNVTITVADSDAKALTAFSFEAANNNPALAADVVAVIAGTSISATVPFNTPVTALVASFTTTGVSVKVGSTVQVSGTTANNFTASVDYIVTAADNSTETYTVTISVAANTAAEITSFKFFSADNNPALTVDVTATISGNQITALVPFGTSVTGLIATFTTTGASVKVGTTVQQSGTTANDFTSPVTYVVTAADGTTTNTYTVTVDNSQNDAKDITAFQILGVDGIFNGTDITLTVPNGTDRSALVPTITITGVSVTPASGTPNDFTTPRTYTVTAADGTTKSYTVTVSVAGNSAKDITRFTINGLDAVIATTSPVTGVITLNMPNGSSLASLTPTITITGVSVSPASGVAQDFSNGPVNYVVTAADGSTKTYTVNIGTVNGNGTNVISSFSILGVQGAITNGTNGTVTLVLPAGTDLSFQTPTITINGSSISPPSRVPQDFRSPVIYIVTAANGATHMYTVTVTTL